MAEEERSNPETSTMVSAQPPALSPTLRLSLIICWDQVIPNSGKQSISVGSLSSAIV